VTMLTQGDRHFALRLVLYDEDATLGPRIAAAVEDDPRWELIALCTTLGDLNFVLNRVTVDVLLLHLTGRSSIGASTGAGGVETGPASSSRSQAGRTTERSAVVSSPLETKFLLFWVGQEQDSCPVAVTGTWLSTAADLLNYGRHGTPKPYVDLHDPRDFVGSATGVLWLHPSAPRLSRSPADSVGAAEPQPVLPAKATHRCITETLLPQLRERGMSRSFDTFGHCGSGSDTEDQKYDGGQEPSLHGELDQAVEEDDGYSQDPRHLPH
jgi:hypothetical protein